MKVKLLLELFGPFIQDERYREFRRKLFHLFYGTFWFGVLWILDERSSGILLGIVLVVGMAISTISKYRMIPFISDMLNIFDRQEDRHFLPGKGALTFTLGILVSVIFFPKHAYLLGILTLSIGDFCAAVVGTYWGSRKIPVLKNRTIEGSLAFFTASLIILLASGVGATKALFMSLCTTITEMLGNYLDDNLFIPSVTAGAYILF